MQLELSYDEVSTVVTALLAKAMTADGKALTYARLGGMDEDVEFWQERAENYRKVYEAVAAQFGQACKECELADAEVKETEVKNA